MDILEKIAEMIQYDRIVEDIQSEDFPRPYYLDDIFVGYLESDEHFKKRIEKSKK